MAGFQPSVKIPDAPPPGKPGLSFTEDGRMKALVRAGNATMEGSQPASPARNKRSISFDVQVPEDEEAQEQLQNM